MGGEKLEFQTYPRANMAISWEIKEGFPKREMFDKAIRMRSTSSLKVKVKLFSRWQILGCPHLDDELCC